MSRQKTSGGLSRGHALLGMIITFLGGYFLGAVAGVPTSGATDEAAKVARTHVPVGLSPSMGARTAQVTIVEFADFECGYCSRSVTLSKQILTDFPGRVRWVFKQFPMNFHRRAKAGAQASMAAHAQGRFWQYHDMLFANRKDLSDDRLLELARTAGLDVKRFKQALDDGAYKQVVDADVALGRKLGVTGTPTFYINGRKYVGSMAYRRITRVIKQELAHTQALLQQGASPQELYKMVTGQGDAKDQAKDKPKAKAGQGKPTAAAAPPAARPRARAKEGTIYRLLPGDSPAMGKATASGTVIMFGDYQCEHTKRVWGSLKQLRERLGGDRLRVVYKQFPLARHAQVRLAAVAALCAHEQGKFWPYHERLFAASEDLSRGVLLRAARAEGMDMDRFISDLGSDRMMALAAADHQLGLRFGTVGTPSLYINGRYVRSVKSTDQLRELVMQELRRAQEALRSGVARQRLYNYLVRDGRTAA